MSVAWRCWAVSGRRRKMLSGLGKWPPKTGLRMRLRTRRGSAGRAGARRGGADGKTKVKEVEWKAETYWHLNRAGGRRGMREGERQVH